MKEPDKSGRAVDWPLPSFRRFVEPPARRARLSTSVEESRKCLYLDFHWSMTASYWRVGIRLASARKQP